MWSSLSVFVLIWCPGVLTVQQRPCPEALSLQLTNVTLLPNISVVSNEGLFPQGTYWQDDTGNYVGCPCNVTRCIRRCPADYFPDDQTFNSSGNSPDVEEPFMIPVWHQGQELSVKAHEHFSVISTKMCENDVIGVLEPHNYPEDEFRILSNGSIHYINDNNRTHGAEHFCLHINKNTSELQAIICRPPLSAGPKKGFQYYTYPVLMLISVFFLALTLLAYVLAPEMRNLHGRSVASHSASLLIGFLGLALIPITGDWIKEEGCYPITLITYYFLLASYFWLNVMSFDIWWTFSGGFRKMTMFLYESKRKKFLAYSAYAWIMPSIFFATTLCLELLPSGIPEDLKPGIGKNSCWFQSSVTSFFYYNGPVLVILLTNMYFFISTALEILKLKKETAILQQSDSRTHNQIDENKQRFKLYLKLFLVMGGGTVFIWTIKIVSSLAGGSEEYWYLTDIIGTLQGVFIFIICVWTTKIRDSFLAYVLPARFAHKLTLQVVQTSGTAVIN